MPCRWVFLSIQAPLANLEGVHLWDFWEKRSSTSGFLSWTQRLLRIYVGATAPMIRYGAQRARILRPRCIGAERPQTQLLIYLSMHACTFCMKCCKKKQIFHNEFVHHSIASCYSPLQTKHFVTLLFSLQFILLKNFYIYLKNYREHCLNLVFKHMGMFQKLHIKKCDILSHITNTN